jgi:hypothetical protein
MKKGNSILMNPRAQSRAEVLAGLNRRQASSSSSSSSSDDGIDLLDVIGETARNSTTKKRGRLDELEVAILQRKVQRKTKYASDEDDDSGLDVSSGADTPKGKRKHKDPLEAFLAREDELELDLDEDDDEDNNNNTAISVQDSRNMLSQLNAERVVANTNKNLEKRIHLKSVVDKRKQTEQLALEDLQNAKAITVNLLSEATGKTTRTKLLLAEKVSQCVLSFEKRISQFSFSFSGAMPQRRFVKSYNLIAKTPRFCLMV